MIDTLNVRNIRNTN
jgi:hypothetical protein